MRLPYIHLRSLLTESDNQPTKPRKSWPHQQGLRTQLFSNSTDVGSFKSHKNQMLRESAVRRTYDFSPFSKKTRKSIYLQMSLQRQHFLLSYSKTLSVGPAKV